MNAAVAASVAMGVVGRVKHLLGYGAAAADSKHIAITSTEADRENGLLSHRGRQHHFKHA